MRYYLCDTTSIALGKIFQISIFSGVKDLKYIAEKLNVKIMVIPEFFFFKSLLFIKLYQIKIINKNFN
jgi:hypothetical protein